MGIPAEPGGKRLGFVMERKGREIVPGGIAAKQFNAAGLEHDLEQEQAKKPQHKARRRRSAPEPGHQLQRGEEDREETGFQQQNVPLKAEEFAADGAQGKVDEPEEEEAGRGGKANEEENCENCAASTLEQEKAVAVADPAEGGHEVIADQTGLEVRVGLGFFIHRFAGGFHREFGGEEAVASDQAEVLRPKRDEGD